MEGLLLLVLEPLLALVGSILLAAALPVLEVVLGVITLALEGAAALLPRREGAAEPSAPPPPPAPRRRWPLRVALGAAGLVLVAWGLLEFAFFGVAVRTALDRAGRKEGLELDYGSAGGWLTTGRLAFRDVKVRRPGGDRDSFDLVIRELEVDARTLSLLQGEILLEAIRVRGVRGTYERQGGAERPPRRPFAADLLEVADARLDWTLRRPDRPDVRLDLEIERLRVAPFESANAAFCVLFRGDGRGSLAGAPWEISGEGYGNGRRTAWKADRVPVRLLSDFLGEPLDWLSEGTVDVRVTDRWRRGEKTEVDLDWRVVFRDLRVAVPDRVEGIRRKVGDAIVALAGRNPKELPLAFTLTLDERGLKGRLSIEGLEIWDAFAAALVDDLAARAGVAKETIREIGRSSWGRMKGWLERRARGGK